MIGNYYTYIGDEWEMKDHKSLSGQAFTVSMVW